MTEKNAAQAIMEAAARGAVFLASYGIAVRQEIMPNWVGTGMKKFNELNERQLLQVTDGENNLAELASRVRQRMGIALGSDLLKNVMPNRARLLRQEKFDDSTSSMMILPICGKAITCEAQTAMFAKWEIQQIRQTPIKANIRIEATGLKGASTLVETLIKMCGGVTSIMEVDMANLNIKEIRENTSGQIRSACQQKMVDREKRIKWMTVVRFTNSE